MSNVDVHTKNSIQSYIDRIYIIRILSLFHCKSSQLTLNHICVMGPFLAQDPHSASFSVRAGSYLCR